LLSPFLPRSIQIACSIRPDFLRGIVNTCFHLPKTKRAMPEDGGGRDLTTGAEPGYYPNVNDIPSIVHASYSNTCKEIVRDFLVPVSSVLTFGTWWPLDTTRVVSFEGASLELTENADGVESDVDGVEEDDIGGPMDASTESRIQCAVVAEMSELVREKMENIDMNKELSKGGDSVPDECDIPLMREVCREVNMGVVKQSRERLQRFRPPSLTRAEGVFGEDDHIAEEESVWFVCLDSETDEPSLVPAVIKRIAVQASDAKTSYISAVEASVLDRTARFTVIPLVAGEIVGAFSAPHAIIAIVVNGLMMICPACSSPAATVHSTRLSYTLLNFEDERKVATALLPAALENLRQESQAAAVRKEATKASKRKGGAPAPRTEEGAQRRAVRQRKRVRRRRPQVGNVANTTTSGECFVDAMADPQIIIINGDDVDKDACPSYPDPPRHILAKPLWAPRTRLEVFADVPVSDRGVSRLERHSIVIMDEDLRYRLLRSKRQRSSDATEEWLNEGTIDMYVAMLNDRVEAAPCANKSVYCFSSTIIRDMLKSSSPHVNVFKTRKAWSYDIWLFPRCIDESHWVLYILDLPARRMMCMDSMSLTVTAHSGDLSDFMKCYRDALQTFTAHGEKAYSLSSRIAEAFADLSAWTTDWPCTKPLWLAAPGAVPHQADLISCGIFVLVFISVILQGEALDCLPKLSAGSIQNARQNIFIDLMANEICSVLPVQQHRQGAVVSAASSHDLDDTNRPSELLVLPPSQPVTLPSQRPRRLCTSAFFINSNDTDTTTGDTTSSDDDDDDMDVDYTLPPGVCASESDSE
jgi:hypothetical protein